EHGLTPDDTCDGGDDQDEKTGDGNLEEWVSTCKFKQIEYKMAFDETMDSMIRTRSNGAGKKIPEPPSKTERDEHGKVIAHWPDGMRYKYLDTRGDGSTTKKGNTRIHVTTMGTGDRAETLYIKMRNNQPKGKEMQHLCTLVRIHPDGTNEQLTQVDAAWFSGGQGESIKFAKKILDAIKGGSIYSKQEADTMKKALMKEGGITKSAPPTLKRPAAAAPPVAATGRGTDGGAAFEADGADGDDPAEDGDATAGVEVDAPAEPEPAAGPGGDDPNITPKKRIRTKKSSHDIIREALDMSQSQSQVGLDSAQVKRQESQVGNETVAQAEVEATKEDSKGDKEPVQVDDSPPDSGHGWVDSMTSFTAPTTLEPRD
ncbi:unnamed protein product, partial [Prorocentrum cordatum]